MIFRRRRLNDGWWTVTFGAAGGVLTYWVPQPEQMVVLLDLDWAG
jgi:phage baseplate assembly protein gpV